MVGRYLVTFALTAALVVVALAAFYVVDRQAKRSAAEHEAYRAEAAARANKQSFAHAEHVATIERLEAAHRVELLRVFAEHRAEVQSLCQRIQAPEFAVVQHQQEHAGPDETQPLTDEEVAELQDRELALERIERMQREGMLT